jgi:hypothetical protein
MKKHHKAADGKYHIGDSVFNKLEGSRAEVMHGTAYKTSGGLLKKDLAYDKTGTRIVSAKKQRTAKAEKRLEKHGFFAEKGKFGFVKRTPVGSPKKSKSRSPPRVRRARTIGGTRKVKRR